MRTKRKATKTRRKAITEKRLLLPATLLLTTFLLVSSLPVRPLSTQDQPSGKPGQAADSEKPDPHKNDPRYHYALIFGTAYDSQNRTVYGVRVQIHPVDKKRPHWELYSDHHGEFAQRVPPGPGDYVVSGQVEVLSEDGSGKRKKLKLKAETRVHIDREEERDIGLHLTE